MEMSVVELLKAGGPVMIPLLICSIIAVAIVINRILGHTRPRKVLPDGMLEQVLQLVRLGQFEQASALCISKASALGRVLLSIIENRHYDKQELIRTAERIGRIEARTLSHRISTLQTIYTVAPLLGLLGTVTGMMRTFFTAKSVGVGDPNLLAGGLAEALIATATGLCVAIPALLFYRLFLNETKFTIAQLETAAAELVDVIADLGENNELQQHVATLSRGR